MNKIYAVVCGLVLFEATAAGKVENGTIAETDFVKRARAELSPQLKTAPSDLKDGPNNAAFVSTENSLSKEETSRFTRSEIELGGQAYSPRGQGRISGAESYSFGSFSSRPMLLLGVRYWFFSQDRWRAGAALDGGASSHSAVLRSNLNNRSSEVTLSSLLVLLGTQAEFYLGSSKFFALGWKLGMGQVVSLQATTYADGDQSQNNAIWEMGSYLRFQPLEKFFLRIGYSRRGHWKESRDLMVQENNYGIHFGITI